MEILSAQGRQKGPLVELTMKKLLYFVVTAFIFFGFPSIVHSGGWIISREGPFKGKIIDAETKEPIEGAIIVAQYHVMALYVVGWRSDLKDIREALTDSKGEFYLPTVTMLMSPTSFGDDTSFLIWKPGYKYRESWGGYFFTKEPGTIENRPTHTDKGLELKPTRLGIVELTPVKTMEERLKSMPTRVGDEEYDPGYKKEKNLVKLINAERKFLGLEPYKQED